MTVLVIGALGIADVSVRYARLGSSWVHPTRKVVTADERARAERIAEPIAFRSDDLTLRGDYVAPKNGVVVVMCHGLFENRMHFLFEAEMLARHGYGALFFDGRAHGDSDGTVATWGDREQRDLEAAIDFASERSGAKIATLGFSIGASTVFLEATHDARVRAVIVEAIWTSLDDEIVDKTRPYGIFARVPAALAMKHAGLDFSNVRPLDHASALGNRPKLFITGTNDEDTPVPIVERVMEAAPEPKEMWIVLGAKHGTYTTVMPDEYERVVIGFLDHAFER